MPIKKSLFEEDCNLKLNHYRYRKRFYYPEPVSDLRKYTIFIRITWSQDAVLITREISRYCEIYTDNCQKISSKFI